MLDGVPHPQASPLRSPAATLSKNDGGRSQFGLTRPRLLWRVSTCSVSRSPSGLGAHCLSVSSARSALARRTRKGAPRPWHTSC
jgi:hypothetical protein